MQKLTPIRRILIGLAALLLILAWAQIVRTDAGVESRSIDTTFVDNGAGGQVAVPPFTVMRPSGMQSGPTVAVVHGFSGSKQLMLGYGHSLARAGYEVLLVDLPGHGRHAAPFQTSDASQAHLVESLNLALAVWEQSRNAPYEQIALLGHSMGTGVVLRAAVENPTRYDAVIAISPGGNRWARDADVNPDIIPNLMLQAGQFEPGFARSAQRWLAYAGGASDDFANRGARTSVVIPSVEHMSILFSVVSHRLTINWLAQAFGTVTVNDYVDGRMTWYGLSLVAVLTMAMAAAPLWRPAVQEGWVGSAENIRKIHIFGLVMATIAAILATALIGQLVDLTSLGGMMVGGGLGLWVFVFGMVWLPFVPRPSWPTVYDVLLGMLAFVILIVAFNLLASRVWLPIQLVPARLLRWPLLILAFLPMQLAAAAVQYPGGFRRRTGWIVAQSAAIFMGLIVTMIFTDGLGFLALVIPLLPLVIGLMTLVGSTVRFPWPFAIGTACWFAWTIASVFPIAQ